MSLGSELKKELDSDRKTCLGLDFPTCDFFHIPPTWYKRRPPNIFSQEAAGETSYVMRVGKMALIAECATSLIKLIMSFPLYLPTLQCTLLDSI